MFHLNLVNGLLVFLLSGLEQALGVINHFFQTVVLVEGEKNRDCKTDT